MYGVFTYVDLARDARNSVLLGMAFAMCTMQFPEDDFDETVVPMQDESDLHRPIAVSDE